MTTSGKLGELDVEYLSKFIRNLQAENTSLVERARVAESKAAPSWMKPALDRAISRGAFVDLNHVHGVLAEEMAELLDEVRRNHGPRGRRELIDIAAACMKAIKQVEDGEL